EGSVQLTGNALLQFTSGQIDTIEVGATLALDGAGARGANASDTSSNSALTGLAFNEGTFALDDGASVTITGDLANSGLIGVDGLGDGGTTFTIGGALINSGALTVGNPFITASSTVTATGLDNTGGSIFISGN